jgi:predicted  nucleic acid-binding Zn-ribbon protein
MTLKPIDYLDSEEAVKEYELSELELSEQNQRSASTTNLIASLRTSLNAVSEEIKRLMGEIEGLKNQEVKAEQEFREMLSRINSNFRRDENAFKTAFGVGQQLRTLNGEPDTTLEGRGASLPFVEGAEL